MNTSMHYDDVSPSKSTSSNSAHFPYNNRGYRKRGSFGRGRGGYTSYQGRNNSSYQWKPRVKDEPADNGLSLLSRIEQDPNSLLHRLSPPKDVMSSPVSPGSLAERISGLAEEDSFSRGDSLARGPESIASSRSSSPRAGSATTNDLLVRASCIR